MIENYVKYGERELRQLLEQLPEEENVLLEDRAEDKEDARLCRKCGAKLSESNTYISDHKHNNRICMACRKEAEHNYNKTRRRLRPTRRSLMVETMRRRYSEMTQK